MANAAWKAGAHDVTLIGTPIAKHFLTTPAVPLSPQLRTVLYAGRLAPEKNIDTFLQAAMHLPHIRFIVAGDGPLRADVEAHAQTFPNLEYLGWLTRADVLSVLDSADLLVLPSTVESFGTVALEAMARRRLVLTSSNCGILNWPSLAQGIFHMQEKEVLSEAIQRVERLDHQIRADKAESAYNAARVFNTRTITQWLEVFRRIVS
jgi:glycosyltransferase involved in cell wall biosynthesis